VCNVLKDIKLSRLTWLREVLGARTARNNKFSEVTTRAGGEQAQPQEGEDGKAGQAIQHFYRPLPGPGGHFVTMSGRLLEKKACLRGKSLPPFLKLWSFLMGLLNHNQEVSQVQLRYDDVGNGNILRKFTNNTTLVFYSKLL
jgi:hypothetical protein